MNIPLLRRIQRQLDKQPGRFKMGWFRSEKECGTSLCIAGWTMALSQREGEIRTLAQNGTIIQECCRLLDIPHPSQSDAWHRLFYQGMWPEQFQGLDDGSEEAAARAIKRIDHFIATNGQD